MARMEYGTNTDADFPIRCSIGVSSVARCLGFFANFSRRGKELGRLKF
jgi:hypothetical protein